MNSDAADVNIADKFNVSTYIGGGASTGESIWGNGTGQGSLPGLTIGSPPLSPYTPYAPSYPPYTMSYLTTPQAQKAEAILLALVRQLGIQGTITIAECGQDECDDNCAHDHCIRDTESFDEWINRLHEALCVVRGRTVSG